jgi:hypothetical protein
MFTTDIEPASWARTPITVTLPNGTTAEALLYHPLSDSWDLDNKYDAQQRAQGTVQPTSVAISGNGNVTVKSPTPVTVTAPTVAVAPPVAAKDKWANLFNSQPSLFPLK